MAEPTEGELIVYEAADGEARVDVRLAGETVWLTQRQMSELFETTPENVVMHPIFSLTAPAWRPVPLRAELL